jgi:hypothetical protein
MAPKTNLRGIEAKRVVLEFKAACAAMYRAKNLLPVVAGQRARSFVLGEFVDDFLVYPID